MHAVVARSTIQDFEQAGKWLQEEALPRLLQTPGFVSGHWVRLDENTGLRIRRGSPGGDGAVEPAPYGHPHQP
jgi:hypothetical protein